MESIERQIETKALELGYEKCGIIPVSDLAEYDRRYAERLEKVPRSAAFYDHLKLTRTAERYPWAKSVVVAVSHFGRYKNAGIPEGAYREALPVRRTV